MRTNVFRRSLVPAIAALALFALAPLAFGGGPAAVEHFEEKIEPLLIDYCYRCHGEGMKKGEVAFDAYDSNAELARDQDLWFRVLKNVRAGLMPPRGKPRPDAKAVQTLVDWVKRDVFKIDPDNIDPGRVVLRRLNRVEYRNTVRDLLGVDFKTEEEFPADDTGYGFDTIGEVLMVSPLLMEKYFQAAETIVKSALEKTANQKRFLRKPPKDWSAEERRRQTRDMLAPFAKKAFRRPVDEKTLGRLVALAEKARSQPGKSFDDGTTQALTAVLASPRFLFRVESIAPGQPANGPALLDEYALASRLSYFLWSTMPDEELFRLADEGKLRAELDHQVQRMLQDDRFKELARNFVGQWLQVRDLPGMYFNEQAILRSEGKRLRGATTSRNVLVGPVRRAMLRETEMSFEYVARGNGSVLDWLDCDYTFLNERLAEYYDVPDVKGEKMRRVKLPKDSPRGGVLTQGAVLAVTSNPARTSLVKRGQFILDNLLGTPAPPSPPNLPALEESLKVVKGHRPTSRELLEVHRSMAYCRSCHARMDPLGFSLDNFNPLGRWRDTENGQKIDPSGQLLTGETFQNARELKHILRDRHQEDFYRCLTDKLLTYAIGRGLGPSDVETVDRIVARLDRENGRFSALLMGVIESSPFQKRRNVP